MRYFALSIVAASLATMASLALAPAEIASADRSKTSTSPMWGCSLLKCRTKVCRRALCGADTAGRRERQGALWGGCLFKCGAKVRRHPVHGADTEGRRERQGALRDGCLLECRAKVRRSALPASVRMACPCRLRVPPAQRVGHFLWTGAIRSLGTRGALCCPGNSLVALDRASAEACVKVLTAAGFHVFGSVRKQADADRLSRNSAPTSRPLSSTSRMKPPSPKARRRRSRAALGNETLAGWSTTPASRCRDRCSICRSRSSEQQFAVNVTGH